MLQNHAKIRPPLHVSLNISTARRCLVTELMRKTCKGGLILSILAAYIPGNLNSMCMKCIETAESNAKVRVLRHDRMTAGGIACLVSFDMQR